MCSRSRSGCSHGSDVLKIVIKSSLFVFRSIRSATSRGFGFDNDYLCCWTLAPATDVNDDVVLELAVPGRWVPEPVAVGTFDAVPENSAKSSIDDWSGDICCVRNASNRAWSGCRSALDGRILLLLLNDGVGEPDGEWHGDVTIGGTTPGRHAAAFGDGDACIESIPESPACKWSQNKELRRRSVSRTWCVVPIWSSLNGGNTKLWPSASPRGESYISRNE